MNVYKKDVFHVHTYRCNHAEMVSDEEYIKKAISIGATGIWFTDHAPFPEDIFGNRMKYKELDEYIKTLNILKEKYINIINVHIGLEIEYFPSFDKNGYYKYLKLNNNLEILLLGQHMAEFIPGHYTFDWSDSKLNNEEYIALGDAIIQGIKSGYFDVVAHPDRIFRRKKEWSVNMEKKAKEIIDVAKKYNIPLEINASSKKAEYHYWKEFWDLANGSLNVNGLDAHFVNELKII